MDYKVLIANIKNITSPIIVRFENQSIEFTDGNHLTEHSFDRQMMIEKIYADNRKVVIELKENDKLNDTNWIGEEQVSYF